MRWRTACRTARRARPPPAPRRRSATDTEVPRANPTKNAAVRNRHNVLRLESAGGYAVEFRLFDEGVAYRFATALPGEATEECAGRRLPEGSGEAWLSRVDGFMTMYEAPYTRVALAGYGPGERMTYLPPRPSDDRGARRRSPSRTCATIRACSCAATAREAPPRSFPACRRSSPGGDRAPRILAEEACIARTKGTRPSRAREEAEPVRQELVGPPAEPAAGRGDRSWVKPDLASWEWRNGLQLTGVDLRAGINTATYKHYIDFAAKYGIPYVILHGVVGTDDRRLPVRSGGRHRRAGRLRPRARRAAGAVADVAGRRTRYGGAVRPHGGVGRRGREDRLHGPQRPVDGGRLRACDALRRRAPPLRRPARLLYPEGTLPHLPQSAQLRGRAEDGAGPAPPPRQQQPAAPHPQRRGSDGLHAGFDALGAARDEPPDMGRRDGIGDTRLPDGALRALRGAAADDGRHAGALRTRGRLHGIHRLGADDMGRAAGAPRRMRRAAGGGAPQGREAVRRRLHERPPLRDGARARFPPRGADDAHDLVRGGRARRPTGDRLQAARTKGRRLDAHSGPHGAQRRPGRGDRMACPDRPDSGTPCSAPGSARKEIRPGLSAGANLFPVANDRIRSI